MIAIVRPIRIELEPEEIGRQLALLAPRDLADVIMAGCARAAERGAALDAVAEWIAYDDRSWVAISGLARAIERQRAAVAAELGGGK